MNSAFMENVNLAGHALRKNTVRAFLSVLGIAIGIAAIVVIMSAGESLKGVFDAQLALFGNDYIQVEIKIPNTSQHSTGNAAGIAQGISITTLTLTDKKSIDQVPNIESSYGAVLGQAIVTSPYEEKRLNYIAASHEYQFIDTTGIASGRFYTDEEERSLARVIVLGSEAARTLFPNQDALGQSVKLAKTSFRVVGVAQERGSTGFISLDEWLIIPLRTAQKLLLGYDHLSFILAQMEDASIDVATAEEITAVMRANHDISDPKKDDFAVTTQAQGLETINTILSGITLVLGIIASIALVVGGVGIMNIMYVAVNERVFEIGLRKAVGARIRHIRNQFLIESVLITMVGGIVGMMLAVLLIILIFGIARYNGFTWPFAVSVPAIVLAVAFSSAIGIAFGYFPAKRASELQPVDALYHKRA